MPSIKLFADMESICNSTRWMVLFRRGMRWYCRTKPVVGFLATDVHLGGYLPPDSQGCNHFNYDLSHCTDTFNTRVHGV